VQKSNIELRQNYGPFRLRGKKSCCYGPAEPIVCITTKNEKRNFIERFRKFNKFKIISRRVGQGRFDRKHT